MINYESSWPLHFPTDSARSIDIVNTALRLQKQAFLPYTLDTLLPETEMLVAFSVAFKVFCLAGAQKSRRAKFQVRKFSSRQGPLNQVENMLCIFGLELPFLTASPVSGKASSPYKAFNLRPSFALRPSDVYPRVISQSYQSWYMPQGLLMLSRQDR